MQVPSTITVVNGIGENQTNLRGFKPTKELFSMEIPDTLTGNSKFILSSNRLII